MNPPLKIHKKRICYIINPVSGIGKRKKIPHLIEKNTDTDDVEYEIAYSEYAGHAIEIAREAARRGFDAVVAVGGDGSINEVVQGILGSQTALGIIPAGSGNGLSHFIRIPFNKEKAIRRICAMKTTLIDTASINDKVFVSVAGAGFDARVAEKFSGSKIRGLFSYSWMVVREYLFYQSKRYKIYVNGRTLRRKAFMLTFANSNQFGFNAQIAPLASLNDGLLDLCILKKPPFYLVIFFLPLLFLGYLHKTPFLEIIKTQEVRVIQRKKYITHVDGDHLYLSKELNVKVNPLSLKIIVP